MNGDEVRAARFVAAGGYDASEVDDLLGRVAEAFDAGQSVGPLIRNAAFRQDAVRGYDSEAVDWFFEQLLLAQDAMSWLR